MKNVIGIVFLFSVLQTNPMVGRGGLRSTDVVAPDPVGPDYGAVQRALAAAMVRSLGQRVLYRLNQPIAYVRRILTKPTPIVRPPGALDVPETYRLQNSLANAADPGIARAELAAERKAGGGINFGHVPKKQDGAHLVFPSSTRLDFTPIFTLAEQALKQDKEIAGQGKSDRFTRFFELDPPPLIDGDQSNQPQADGELLRHRLHLPVEKLAELLLWDSGPQDLQNKVRAKSEGFLRCANPKAYPQIKRILELYESFKILKDQVSDIHADANGENDKKLVVEGLKAFLEEIEAVGSPLKDFVFIKNLQTIVTEQLKTVSSGFFDAVEQQPFVKPELPPVVISDPVAIPDVLSEEAMQKQTDVFKQRMEGVLSEILGSKPLEVEGLTLDTTVYLQTNRLNQLLIKIGKEKDDYGVYLKSLRESHDDALVQKMTAQLQPLYDKLVVVEKQLKKTKKGVEIDTTPWWRKAHTWWKKLTTSTPKLEESSVDQFLQDPLTYLQDQSFDVRGQLRILKETFDSDAFEKKLKTLNQQIGSKKISVAKAKKQLVLLEKTFELLQKPAQVYEDLYNTYTILSSPKLFTFEEGPDSKPLTNAAVVRFIATALDINKLQDVSSLSRRQEFLDKLIATRDTKTDPGYRELSQVLSNDFVWEVELRKLAGEPVAIDSAKMRSQLANFTKSYRELSRKADSDKIALLIKTIKADFPSLPSLDKSEPVVVNPNPPVAPTSNPVHPLPVIIEEEGVKPQPVLPVAPVVVGEEPKPEVVVSAQATVVVNEVAQPVTPVAPVVVEEVPKPEVVVPAQGPVVANPKFSFTLNPGRTPVAVEEVPKPLLKPIAVTPVPVVKPAPKLAPKPIQEILEPIQKQVVAVQAKMLEIKDILKTSKFTPETVTQFKKASQELQALEKSSSIFNPALADRTRKEYMMDSLNTDLKNSIGTVFDNTFITNYLTMLDKFVGSYGRLTTKMQVLRNLQEMQNKETLCPDEMKKLRGYATAIPIREKVGQGFTLKETGFEGFENYVRKTAKELLRSTGPEQTTLSYTESKESVALENIVKTQGEKLQQVSTKITKAKADLANQFDSMQGITDTVLAKTELDPNYLQTLYNGFKELEDTISQRAGIARELDSIVIPAHLDLQDLINQKFLLGLELESLYLQRLQRYREMRALNLGDLENVGEVFNKVGQALDTKGFNGFEETLAIKQDTVEDLRKLLIWESSNKKVQKYVRDTAANYLNLINTHDEAMGAMDAEKNEEVKVQLEQLEQAVKSAPPGSEALNAAKLALDQFKKQFEITAERNTRESATQRNLNEHFYLWQKIVGLPVPF